MKNKITYAVNTLRPCMSWLIVGIIFIFIIDGISLLTPLFIGKLIDSFAEVDNYDAITLWISLIGIAIITHIATLHISAILSLKKYIFHIERYFQIDAMQRIKKFSIGQIQEKNSGEILSITLRGVRSFSDMVQLFLYDLIPSISYMLVVIIGMFFISWEINLILIASIIMILVINITVTLKFSEPLNTQQKKWQKIDTSFSEFLRNLSRIKFSSKEDEMINSYKNKYIFTEQKTRDIWIHYNTQMLLMQGVYLVSIVALLGTASYFVVMGKYSAGSFVIIYSWSMNVMSKAKLLRRIFRNITRALPGMQQFYDLIHEKPAIVNFGSIEKIDTGKVVFNNVRYCSLTEKAILKSINFTIHAGEYVGIVGKSGSGKSTLANLLLRSYETTSGNIYIDDIPLSSYAETYRRDIAFVEQSPSLFDESIRYNMSFGNLNDFTEQELWDILKKVHLYDMVSGSQHGLDTIIGERGIRLSGGEAQRLIIARALLQKAKIIILDEATSALDEKTQSDLQEILEEIRSNITTIVIAHRTSTLKNCDAIIEIKNGIAVKKYMDKKIHI